MEAVVLLDIICKVVLEIIITSSRVAVPLLGSTAPNVQASRWLPRMTNLEIVAIE